MEIIDKGVIAYRPMLEEQQARFDAMVSRRQHKEDPGEECLYLVEHEPVFTLGRHGKIENMLFPEEEIRRRGADVLRIGRGGDITFHGPGQLVVYPIIDLQKRGLGIKDYVWILEEAVIRTIADFGVEGERVEGATGVWIEPGTPRERKICAIGVKASRGITMHGLALNVATDLRWFSLINPCGFVDKGVTSLALECPDNPPAISTVKSRFLPHFLHLI